MSFSAVMTAVRVIEADRGLPFAERAGRVLDLLKRSGDIGRPYVVEEIPCDPDWEPFTPRIDEIQGWGMASGPFHKRLSGYPDFEVIDPTTALSAWAGEEERGEKIEAMWGDDHAELIARLRASRARVRAWLEGLPDDALMVVTVWDDS